MRVSPTALATQALLSLPALLLAACAAAPSATPTGVLLAEPGALDQYVRTTPGGPSQGPSQGYRAQQGQYDRVQPHEAGRYERAPNGRIAFLLGRRELDDPFFDGFGNVPVDNPGVLGVEFSQVPAAGALGFEFGVNFGADREDDVNGFDTEVTQAEVYAGLRAEFGQNRVRPYIGGGGVLLSTTVSQDVPFGTVENDDTTFGGYVHGGIQADVSDYVFIGLDYRHVFGADFEIGTVDVDGDYDQVSLVIGMTL